MEGSGAHERHIVRSTLAQQIAQVYGVLAMLAVITLLGRTLPLNEFGLYGLLLSTTVYVLLLQTSVSGAAVRAIASALDVEGRERAFSVTVALYAVAGVIAGVLVALTGLLLAAVLDLSPGLREQAREAGLALGVATALGWPAKAFQDSLRGVQRFAAAAVAEIVANTILLAGMVALVELDAALWALIALGGALPILIGIACGLVLLVTGGALRFRRSLITRGAVRDLLGVSAYLSSIGVADVVINTLDRIILAAFRSTATVGLYEGAARPHALVRQLHATLALTVVPVASGYIAAGDDERLHDLLLRGTRYVMAVVVPVTVVLMVLSDRILDVWLGPKFVVAAPAMAILLSYWLANSATGVAGGMLVAVGRFRELNRYAWTVAVMNLTLSIALTPWLGLEGVVIGTALPYLVVVPWLIQLTLRAFPIPLARLARVAWVPAYATGALVAAFLGLARLLLPLDSLLAVLLVGAAALALGWGAYAAFWMEPSERRMVRTVLRRRVAAA
jgi:O-antigen/teichoic acid export membrane protein